MTTLAERIARTLDAYARCVERDNTEWRMKHEATLGDIERNQLPSGSGIDAGTTIDRGRSNLTRLVFRTSFHHMNEHGVYDGWTEHVVTARPTFIGLEIKVSGPDRNGVKDYLADVFLDALSSEV